MTAVRCAGRLVVIQDRESPTEYDMEPSCGWSGAVEPDWEVVDDLVADGTPEAEARRFALGRCPNCRGVLEPVPEPPSRLDLDPIRRWYGQAPAVTAAQRLTRDHVGYLLDEVDEVQAIELAALALLRVSGPDASWGDHETAERVLRGLLVARGHEVGERAS